MPSRNETDWSEWSDDQKRSYAQGLREEIDMLNQIIKPRVDGDGKPSYSKNNHRMKATQQRKEVMQELFSLENSMSGEGDLTSQNSDLRRQLKSLRHELDQYRKKFGEMFIDPWRE